MNTTKVIHTLIHALTISLFIACSAPLKPISDARQNYVIGTGGYNKSAVDIDSMILPYRIPLQQTMNEVLAISDTQAVKGTPESNLGNLVCDLLLKHSEKLLGKPADIAFYNTGGLRIELPKGKITRSMIFELAPFDNELVSINVLGKDLSSFINLIAEKKGPIAGFTLGISASGAHQVKIGNQAINPEKVYTIISNDYLINGNDGYKMPRYSDRKNLKIKLRDALIEELQAITTNKQQLHPRTDGRIYFLDTP